MSIKHEAANQAGSELRNHLLQGARDGRYVECPLPPILIEEQLSHGTYSCSAGVVCAKEGDPIIMPDGSKGVITKVSGSEITVTSERPLGDFGKGCIIANNRTFDSEPGK